MLRRGNQDPEGITNVIARARRKKCFENRGGISTTADVNWGEGRGREDSVSIGVKTWR